MRRVVGAVAAGACLAVAVSVAVVVVRDHASTPHGSSAAALGPAPADRAVGADTVRGRAQAGTPSASAPSAALAGAAGSLTAKKPAPAPDPCIANNAAQFVLVSIRLQHAWMCAGHHLAYSTAVTTGMSGPDNATPVGTFAIQGRNTDTVLSPSTGGAYPVKYWIPFQAPLYGFHDASWQNFPFGSARYRSDGSHGCVHMPLTAMKFLYDWVQIGASVRIDP